MNYFLIIFVNLIYLPAIKYGLVSDDATALKTNPYPVRREKIGSIVLHILVAEYIYLAFGSTLPALIAAILFSIHPATVQISCWRSGKYYGLNALLFLVILTFAPISAPLYFLTLKWGLGTITFTPLIFLFTKYWYIALIFPLLFWISWKYIKGNISSKIKGDGIFTASLPEDFTPQKFRKKNLIIMVKTFGFYFLSCLLPIKNGFYNSFLSTLGSSEKSNKYWYSFNKHFWGGVFAMITMAAIWWFNRFNFIGMGIMLFVLSLIPFLNIITVQQFTASRYVYLPLIGFQIALIGLVAQLPIIPQSAILGALFIFYLDRTLRVMRHYSKDNITMVELDSQVFPDNPRLWYFRYEHMLHKGNPVMAWAEATYGLKYLPEDCQLWFGLSCASFELGDMNAATEFLKTSERFMLLTERENMAGLILEMRQRIKKKLVDKWKGGIV